MTTHGRQSEQKIEIDFEVDGEVWRRVPTLDDCGPDDHVYIARTNEDGTTTLIFGDGKHGARLPTGSEKVILAFKAPKRYTAVLAQQGRVILDRDWHETETAAGRFYGIYHAIVTDNVDPSSVQRIRVQVPDVLGNREEWALPCVPVGATGVPAIGQAVWIAFDSGDPSRPVWIGTFGR